MKPISTIFASAIILASLTSPVLATEYVKGVVKKVDARANKVTIIHEELKSLDMPAMTMVFRAADDAMLARFKEGDEIEFVAERVDGKLTVTELKGE